MQDISTFLEDMKASPYEEVIVRAPHTGVVHFTAPAVGTRVLGASGEWGERPGTPLAVLTREHNPKNIAAPQKGELRCVHTELEGKFVDAGTVLAEIRHFLSREEVITRLLRHALSLFNAPERAKYFFTPTIDAKVKASGCRSVHVQHGMELFIMSRMKRETPVYYTGPSGIIYSVYFTHSENVDAGSPLIGVCPADQVSAVEDMVLRVQTEWKENE